MERKISDLRYCRTRLGFLFNFRPLICSKVLLFADETKTWVPVRPTLKGHMQKARSMHAIAVVDVKVFCPPGETHSLSPFNNFLTTNLFDR